MHENIRRYTWRRKNPRQQARLDFFLASEDIFNIVTKSEIIPGYSSDHSASCQFTNVERERGYWKLNCSLLRDKEYIDLVNNMIDITIEEYAFVPYDRDRLQNIPSTEVQLCITDKLFLDTLLMKIGGATIQYASTKKEKESKAENDLETKIGNDFQNDVKLEELVQARKHLEAIRNTKIQGTQDTVA